MRGSADADVAVDGEEVVAAVGGLLQVGLEVVELGAAGWRDGAEPLVDDLGLAVAEGVGAEFAFDHDADVDLDVAEAGAAHEGRGGAADPAVGAGVAEGSEDVAGAGGIRHGVDDGVPVAVGGDDQARWRAGSGGFAEVAHGVLDPLEGFGFDDAVEGVGWEREVLAVGDGG